MDIVKQLLDINGPKRQLIKHCDQSRSFIPREFESHHQLQKTHKRGTALLPLLFIEIPPKLIDTVCAAVGFTTLSIYLKCIEQKLFAERSFYSRPQGLIFTSWLFI